MAANLGQNGKGFHEPRYRNLIERLIAARKRLKLSQRQLANRIGHHQQFVSRYETGERRLDIVEFIDIARSLNLDVHDLLGSI